MADTIIAWALIGTSLAFILLAGLLRAAKRRMPAPTNAARPVAPPAQPVGRAPRVPPALRVHLCANCGTHGVPRPGEWCMPCVYRTSPVHRAEEILTEAARRSDAS